ncbi:MAG: hypothetical protein Q8O41_08940, partial [Candidatus Methanoperedens sp.]|nr:hypothetical protein [Candidatus Methanoperedens sp.]
KRKLFCGVAIRQLAESGGGAEHQFRSKKVRAFSNKGHQYQTFRNLINLFAGGAMRRLFILRK